MSLQQTVSDATTAIETLSDRGVTVLALEADADGYTLVIDDDPDDVDTSGVGGGVIKGGNGDDG